MKVQTSAGEVVVYLRYSNGKRAGQRTVTATLEGALAAKESVTNDSRDKFVRSVGRRLALTRALATAGATREVRSQIWSAIRKGNTATATA